MFVLVQQINIFDDDSKWTDLTSGLYVKSKNSNNPQTGNEGEVKKNSSTDSFVYVFNSFNSGEEVFNKFPFPQKFSEIKDFNSFVEFVKLMTNDLESFYREKLRGAKETEDRAKVSGLVAISSAIQRLGALEALLNEVTSPDVKAQIQSLLASAAKAAEEEAIAIAKSNKSPSAAITLSSLLRKVGEILNVNLGSNSVESEARTVSNNEKNKSTRRKAEGELEEIKPQIAATTSPSKFVKLDQEKSKQKNIIANA